MRTFATGFANWHRIGTAGHRNRSYSVPANVASMIAVARSSVLNRWPQTVRVIAGDPCPSRRLIVNTSRPDAIKLLAWVCRKLCRVATMPAFSKAFAHFLVRAFGNRGDPSGSPNTRASSGALPLPVAKRNSCWIRLCVRSSAMVEAGRGIDRRRCFVFVA